LKNSYPLDEEKIIGKCAKMDVEYVKYSKQFFNGKIKWVITYRCKTHGEIETSWDSMKKDLKGCKYCVRERKTNTDLECELCNRGNDEVKIIKTNRFGRPMILCQTHYYQGARRDGKFRSAFRYENEIIEHDDYLEMYLYNRKGEVVASTYFDKEHRDIAESKKWSLKSYPNRYSSYVISVDSENNRFRFHNFIAERLHGLRPENMTVDHKDRDGLNNRNSNLSYKDQTDQNLNQRTPKNNKSGVKGVSRFQVKYWAAQIGYRHIKLHKIFKDFDKAVEKRKHWEALIEQGRIDLLEMEKGK
jgi:hypothetical protein